MDGFFADPNDADLEAKIEKRLADEIEHPVNQFITHFSDASFILTDTQRKQMTRYVALLFNRSMGRRAAARYHEKIKVYALQKFLANETQVATVAAHWNIEAHFKGLRFGRLLTKDDVVRAARNLSIFHDPAFSEQESYVGSIVRFLAFIDETMLFGEWKLVSATADNPFILSDSPVVTWDRRAPNGVSYGVGFHEPNVEVFLPVSPRTCLYILPKVKRSRPIIPPQVEEINLAQAAFAYRACFANQNKLEIDNIVQRHISTVKLGENAFTLPFRRYDNLFYDILMRGGGDASG
jgi:hypothetical protein